MQFVDEVTVHVASGSGGNGIVAWRREKYVPFGGPAGGDGGRGGSVYLEASPHLNTLLDFRFQMKFQADDGERGRSKSQHGRSAEDLILKVPVGTIVRDADSGDAIADLREPGQQVLVAAGGRGGRGNTRFTSSRRQSPEFAEPGEAGIERTLILELKLLADVGIVGMPNAGKSTFISAVSAARPKIANYPFTTLTPNLGVARRPAGIATQRDTLVLADIPGLIEGASQGAGLGHAFLRHVERTRLLLHLVSLAEPDAEKHHALINAELAAFSQTHPSTLAQKPQIVLLSQADTVLPEEAEPIRAAIQAAVGPDTPILTVSAVTGQGMEEAMSLIFQRFEQIPETPPVVALVADPKATDHDDSAFTIEQLSPHTFEVHGGKVGRLISATDMRNPGSVHRTMGIFQAMGVFKALAQAGAELGDTVLIQGTAFEYEPPEPARR